jgi:hypothetical protein
VVKVLCYKSQGCWFDSRWCHWNFSLTYSFRSHYGPGVDSTSKRNECQEHFLRQHSVVQCDNWFIRDMLCKTKIIGTFILTPWCRVLLEKLTGLQLVKKFPAFYGTRRFITALNWHIHIVLKDRCDNREDFQRICRVNKCTY